MIRTFAKALQVGLKAADIELEADIMQKLEQHWELLAEHQQKFNLTAIRDGVVAARKHYLDCLLLLPLLREAVAEQQQAGLTLTAADIGSGAGFPGLVLALACPQSSWVLVEANGKKCRFLNLCLEKLAIENARVLPLRAETIGQKAAWRGQFDLVTARAVAALPVLLEYAMPLLRVGGTFIAAKGPSFPEEEAAAATALTVLGAQPAKKQAFALPGGDKRILACYSKTQATSEKYPRRAGIPEKKPL